jgi:hypothetical protein
LLGCTRCCCAALGSCLLVTGGAALYLTYCRTPTNLSSVPLRCPSSLCGFVPLPAKLSLFWCALRCALNAVFVQDPTKLRRPTPPNFGGMPQHSNPYGVRCVCCAALFGTRSLSFGSLYCAVLARYATFTALPCAALSRCACLPCWLCRCAVLVRYTLLCCVCCAVLGVQCSLEFSGLSANLSPFTVPCTRCRLPVALRLCVLCFAKSS